MENEDNRLERSLLSTHLTDNLDRTYVLSARHQKRLEGEY